jgi:hypothetical protein
VKKYIFILLAAISIIQNMMGDEIDIIYNEYWGKSVGSAAAVYFNHYFFHKNGTFLHKFGYSGGMFFENYTFGKYVYNNKEKIIKLEAISGADVNKKMPMTADVTPSTIVIIELTDEIVKFYENDNVNAIVIMQRKRGMISDQYWYKGWDSSHDRIGFDIFGQCRIKRNENEYVCEYNFIDNILYLKVKSITLERKTKQYIPFKKTYIRVEIEEEIVDIEKIEFENILDGSRDWEYNDGKYSIKNNSVEIEWEEYNRVADDLFK